MLINLYAKMAHSLEFLRRSPCRKGLNQSFLQEMEGRRPHPNLEQRCRCHQVHIVYKWTYFLGQFVKNQIV